MASNQSCNATNIFAIHLTKCDGKYNPICCSDFKIITLSERKVALVSQWSVNKFGRIALVFVRIVKFCIFHLHYTLSTTFYVIPEVK